MTLNVPLITQSIRTLNGTLQSFRPEPRNGNTFSNILNGMGDVANTLIGIDPEYQSLLQTQMQMQEQMQRVSLVSNIERSRHESKMAAIRNVRTG